jgi:hypothetical protein
LKERKGEGGGVDTSNLGPNHTNIQLNWLQYHHQPFRRLDDSVNGRIHVKKVTMPY